MTVEQIRQSVVKTTPVSRRQLYRYLRSLNIQPIGTLRRKPQQYPENAAVQILSHLGYITGSNGRHLHAKTLSMRQLRSAKLRSQKARAA